MSLQTPPMYTAISQGQEELLYYPWIAVEKRMVNQMFFLRAMVGCDSSSASSIPKEITATGEKFLIAFYVNLSAVAIEGFSWVHHITPTNKFNDR